MHLFKRRALPWQDTSVFLKVLRLAFHTDAARALNALLGIARGKRVRGWRQLCTTAMGNEDYYECWTRIAEPLLFERYLGPSGPVTTDARIFCMIISEGAAPSAVARTLDSVRQALGPDAVWWVKGDGVSRVSLPSKDGAESLVTVLEQAADAGMQWVLPIRAGDTTSPMLGRSLVQASNAATQPDILYWDEDLDSGGRRDQPWIKPSWDEWLYLSRDCLSGSCAIRTDTALATARTMETGTVGLIGLTALILRMTSAASEPPHHIPLILTHRCDNNGFAKPEEWVKLVGKHWREPITLDTSPTNVPFLRASPARPEHWPSVSIVIPTRNHADVLAACLAGLGKLEYPGQSEILIVDNGSEEAGALELLARVEASGRARVLRRPEPFNFSALNNRATEQALGEYLCLLNNDIEAMDGDWLTAMVAHAVRPGIGAVGAQLLYPDGTIQHAGVVIGMGEAAGHLQRGVDPGTTNHISWHNVTRRVSAVTAACLLVRREHFLAVGGLDETGFAVAFNDVDLCLKLRQMGLSNLYVAEARLIHHESKSRGNDYAPEHSERFRREHALLQQRWQTPGYEDPHYSPLFSKVSEQCLLPF